MSDGFEFGSYPVPLVNRFDGFIGWVFRAVVNSLGDSSLEILVNFCYVESFVERVDGF